MDDDRINWINFDRAYNPIVCRAVEADFKPFLFYLRRWQFHRNRKIVDDNRSKSYHRMRWHFSQQLTFIPNKIKNQTEMNRHWFWLTINRSPSLSFLFRCTPSSASYFDTYCRRICCLVRQLKWQIECAFCMFNMQEWSQDNFVLCPEFSSLNAMDKMVHKMHRIVAYHSHWLLSMHSNRFVHQDVNIVSSLRILSSNQPNRLIYDGHSANVFDCERESIVWTMQQCNWWSMFNQASIHSRHTMVPGWFLLNRTQISSSEYKEHKKFIFFLNVIPFDSQMPFPQHTIQPWVFLCVIE